MGSMLEETDVAKKQAANTNAEESPCFEDSLADLQGIVQRLEDGSDGLEESLRQFERGIGLLRTCYNLLEGAERRGEILTGFDAAGQPITEPFDDSATVDQGKAGRRGGSGPARGDSPDTGGLF